MSNDKATRAKFKDPEWLKLFIDLCLEETEKGNFSGSSLKGESWDRIRQVFKEKKNVNLTQKQLRNNWDYLKLKYQTWMSIFEKTGNTNLDPVTNKINWTDEKWEEEIKLNPKVGKFRYKPLEYLDELRAMFDGLLATGKDAWGPSKEGLPMDSMQSTINTDEIDDVPSSSDVKVKQETKRRKRNNTSEKVDEVEVQLLAAIKSIEKSDGPSIDECNKVLEEMKTLDMADPLYIAATSIFCENKAYREQWIRLSDKSEEFRKSWIAMNGRRLGLL